jgi:hypothetical protein
LSYIQKVIGSSPFTPTIETQIKNKNKMELIIEVEIEGKKRGGQFYDSVTQLVEYHTFNMGVVRSNRIGVTHGRVA